jgi:uncharacterized protein (DUF2141 family)
MSAVVVIMIAVRLMLPGFQMQRDGVREARTGSAVVTGVVLIDDRDARPLRRARVVLGGDGLAGRTAITEDDGSFRFTDVPSGRYRVSATRAGFVTTAFGASRPGRQGKQVVVTDGAEISHITIKVPRGAVISGTVLDPNSQPLASATVRALRYAMENGERTLVSTHELVTTDDRGEYRIFGLAAGEYILAASMRSTGVFTEGMQQITGDDLGRLKMGLRQAPAEPRRSDGAVNASLDGVQRRAVKYAAVFYPGTNSVSQAIAVRIGAGEERIGVDIPVQFEPVANLSGAVSLPSDGFAPSYALNLIETGRPFIPGITDIFSPMQTTSSGKFLIPNVSPGIYTLAAESTWGARFWAQSEVVVSGDDMPDISLMLQPAMTFAGRIRADVTTDDTPDFTKSRITLSPAQSNRVTFRLEPAQIRADGTFVITGVTPGRYRIRASAIDSRGRTWMPLSANVDGRDVLDFPIEIRAGQNVADAEISFTDRPTELSGSVRDLSGQPQGDAHVIVFAADRTFWTPQSRRIAATQPAAEGRYSFRNLPAGEYMITAIADVEDGEWFDPAFLETLLPSAQRVTLAASDKQLQDLTIRSAVDARQ